MTTIPFPINFTQWISDNEHLLKPPVNNKTMAVGNDFIVQVVGGPNARTDFHVDPYEEWFYQLRGNMHVNLMTDGPQTVHIREGDTWLLPGNTPALAAASRSRIDRIGHRTDPGRGDAGEVPVVLRELFRARTRGRAAGTRHRR